MSSLVRATSLFAVAVLSAPLAAQNNPPNTPSITEPPVANAVLHPQDVHMETSPFSDPDPGDQHEASNWQIWRTSPSELVWESPNAMGLEKVHAHLGDGTFMGSHAGLTQLFDNTNYRLRVRHRDNSGDPATQWSGWAETPFRTTVATQIFPLFLDDVSIPPQPSWIDDNTGLPIDLAPGTPPASLRVEGPSGELLLRIDGTSAPGNLITDPGLLMNHVAVRIVIEAGLAGPFVIMPPSTLRFAEHGCDINTILLPGVLIPANQRVDYWIARNGDSYFGNASQTAPDFSSRARGGSTRWVTSQAGYTVDEFATDLRLPVNIAFIPNAGSAPTDPFFYVTELYGTIKTVLRNGSTIDYATNLLNYTPSGAFPGSGEQGLAGLAVDPVTGDVFASLLNRGPGGNEPRVVRFTSMDGGRTAASQITILFMPGEFQGQSHQISALEIVGDKLYCHMGDGFNSGTAQNLNSYRGKILCMNLDGSAATTNPFYDASNGISARDYIFSYGVRNPFGGAWRASDGERYCVENGPTTDRFAKLVSGRNYRWNGSDSSMRNFALYNWAPPVGPVNIAFVQPETFGGSGFPPGKFDHAFVTESGPTYGIGPQANGKRITEWILDAAGNRIAGPIPFIEYAGSGRSTVCGLAAGPDGLYFTELYAESGSNPTARGARVMRIRFGSANDCNQNGLQDPCEIALGLTPDCNGNSVPDECDISSGTSTDFNGNLIPDECDPLSEDRDRVSLGTGGTIQFELRAGQPRAALVYFLLGSATGSTPGVIVDGVRVPLNILADPWFPITLTNPNQGIFQTTLGNLNSTGEGNAAIVVPPGTDPSLAGLTLNHAYVVLDPMRAYATIYASNAVPVTFDN